MCILLTVMTLLAAVLVDGARMRICEAEAQSASDSAARSVLAGYDGMLKEIYGLFALADGNPEVLNDEVHNYLNKILLTELGMDEKSIGEKAFSYLKKIFTGQLEFDNVSFANLFDYRIENVNITPVYSLIDNRVLKGQILNYMKYRAPVNITRDLVDKFLSFMQFGKQTELIGKKVKLDRELYKISKTQSNLAVLTEELVAADSEAGQSIGDKLRTYNELVEMQDEGADSYKKDFGNYLESLNNKYSSTVKCIANLKNNAGKSYQMIKALEEGELKDDESDLAEKLREELKKTEEGISEVWLDEIENNLNAKQGILSALEGVIKGSKAETLPDQAFELAAQYSDPIRNITKYNFDGAGAPNSNNAEDPRLSAEEALSLNLTSLKKENTENSPFTISGDLVSKNKEKILLQEKELLSSLYTADTEYMTKIYKRNTSQIEELIVQNDVPADVNEAALELLDNIDFSESGNMEEGFNLVKLLSEGISKVSVNILDGMYLNEYIEDKFKNALTIEGNSERQTHFDAEMEYILAGKLDEKLNKYITQGQILLLRFALNTIYIYMDQLKVNQALAAATAIAGWTGFGIPIVQTVIMMAWSMSESILDVRYLMSGRQIPIIKSSQTWMLGTLGAIKTVLLEVVKETSQVAIDGMTDYAQLEVERFAEDIVNKVDSIVEGSIDTAIDKAFTPIEAWLVQTGLFSKEDSIGAEDSNKQEDNYDEADSHEETGGENELSLQNSSLESFSDSMVMQNILSLINAVVGEEFDKISQELQDIDRNTPRDIVKDYILSKKDQIRTVAVNKVNDLKIRIVNEIKETAKKGKIKLDKYLDNVFGRQAKIQLTGEMQSNIVTMGYVDYLKLFLLIKDENVKLDRIQDLIQLNMRKESGDPGFLLQNYYTCLRADVTVSISRIFAVGFTSPKSGSETKQRYNYRYVIYDNY